MALFATKKPRTYTNAPRHWPAIELNQFENAGVNTILIGAQLASLHKPPSSKVAFVRDFLYEDGILRVPVMVEEGGQKTCVFSYSKHDREAAAHYCGVRALLRARENAQAVYYGPEALTPVKPGVVLRPIDTPFFATPGKPDQNTTFALWWATEELPKLAGSDEVSFLDQWFEAMDGYGFVLLTAFLKDLEMVRDPKGVYALPEQPLLQPVSGPAQTRMLLCASAAEGLSLAFDESTPPGRRRILLKLLADFATGFRRAIESKGLPPRAEERGRGLERWRAVRDAALSKEASGETGLKVHSVVVQDGQPIRNWNASTAGDRAAQPAGPDRGALDFGMDLVDRVVARCKNRPAQGSTQEQIGGPNFFPVIAAKVGSDILERQVPYEDTPVAQEAASRVLDEWPDAEIVAVVADGAVRENGKRVDAFLLKVEKRGAGGAGELFQRYRVGDGGAIELVGRPTATPVESFLLEPGASREPVPAQELTALAGQALETIVAHLTIVEPSGMCGDDPEETLLSPSALLGLPGESRPTTVRFMLQGPVTAAGTCYALAQEKSAEWVAFHMDDLVSRNGVPERRLRLCVQRRQDPQAAIFDQHFESPRKGHPFTVRGGLEFKRWGGSLFPPPAV